MFIEGVGGKTPGRLVNIIFKIYEENIPCQALAATVPHSVIGMDMIPKIWPIWRMFKKIKNTATVFAECHLAALMIEPITLPKIEPVFQKQYPIKGGHQQISNKVEELLKEGIIETTTSFKFNSPVWPVLKPNGDYRFTVDYRKVNERTPLLEGTLPDIQTITNQIVAYKPKFFATIDLSDMFFAIPLHEESREWSTFTWNNRQYRFTRLPQGYKNSPIIAHHCLTRSLPETPEGVKLWSYVDDILIAGLDKDSVEKALKIVTGSLITKGWTIQDRKIQLGQQVKFLGILWSADGPFIPEGVIDKIQNIRPPEDKNGAQKLIGLFGYWKHHIPYLQILLTPIYKVTRKATEFVWGEAQEKALKQVKEYIQMFRQLGIPLQTDTIVLEVTYVDPYGNWGIFVKRRGRSPIPCGFHCKKFPFSENKYSFFEKLIWTAYEATKMLSLIRTGQPLILRTPVPIIEWVKMPAEQLAGAPIEQRAMKWKWYLEGLLIDKTESSTSQVMEEMTDHPLVPVPEKPKEMRLIPLAKWGPRFQNQKTAWFTDGSAKVTAGKLHWKAAAWNPMRRETLVSEGTDSSAQYAELKAVEMAITWEREHRESVVYIYTDSWAVANGLTIWSGRWRINDWRINKAKVWSEDVWRKIEEYVNQGLRIYVTHVDAHTNRQDEESVNNAVADKLAAMQIKTEPIKLKRHWKVQKDGDKMKLKGTWKIDKGEEKEKPNRIEATDTRISRQEIGDIHRSLGHLGRHAMLQWFGKRNLKVDLSEIARAIGECQQCPKHRVRFKAYGRPDDIHWPPRNTIQMDFIRPLNNIGYNNWYICTLVEVYSGLGFAKHCRSPTTDAAIQTLWSFLATHPKPTVLYTDNGTHFTSRKFKKTIEALDIIHNLHLAYNPQAAGNVERFNGLLKNTLRTLDLPIEKAIPVALTELNNRPRLYRKSPLEEYVNSEVLFTLQEPTGQDDLTPTTQKVLIKDNENNVGKGEIVTKAGGNSYWVTTGRGTLKIVKTDDLLRIE